MAEHTPGPWYVHGEWITRTAARPHIDTDEYPDPWTRSQGRNLIAVVADTIDRPRQETDANARLIAAAPEMEEFIRGIAGEPHGVTCHPGCNRCEAKKLLKRLKGTDSEQDKANQPHETNATQD